MPVRNSEIAEALNKLADLLEIEGENRYRIRAYRNASRTVESMSRNLADMVRDGEDLSKLPGIGDAISAKIAEIVETGRMGALEQEQKKLPSALTDMLKIPALGPKRVHAIYDKLKVSSRKELECAAKSGQIRDLEGFGEKTEKKILEYLQRKDISEDRTLLSRADEILAPLVEYLEGIKGVKKVTAAGSSRRRRETVGDGDILATCAKGSRVMDTFAEHEDVVEILAKGETKTSVVVRGGFQVDLRVVPQVSYGAALHYFTGSKAHNVAIRTRGVRLGLKINEYGVYRGEERIGGKTEEEVFKSVGLAYIEPELRENTGEIEAAENGTLPRLIEQGDIRGDLQSHTTETDGHASLEKMAEAAIERGYEYLAITDHSKRVAMAHGLNATRLARQIKAIDKLNSRFDGFRLLKSVEVDILEDGSLDLSDDILKELDLVVAAVHYGASLSEEKQTERIIRAMDNPYVNILAHPTGRLINDREPYAVNIETLIAAAAERGCFMEINSQPSRLDLKDSHARMAVEAGLKLAISTDAHSEADLALMKYGVSQARRGWLTKEDVLNTRSAKDLMVYVSR